MTTSTTLNPTPTTGAAARSAAGDRRATDATAWTEAAVADLAAGLAVDGTAAHAADLRSLAAWACDVEVAPALLTVLTDATAPEVVRLRAFARVASAVTAA